MVQGGEFGLLVKVIICIGKIKIGTEVTMSTRSNGMSCSRKEKMDVNRNAWTSESGLIINNSKVN
jgi:hypothetical protein